MLTDEDGLAVVREYPWLRGIASGGVAWLLGYLVTAGLFYVGPASIDVPSQFEKLKQIGGVFYNAHLVDMVATVGEKTTYANVVVEGGGTTIPTAVYLAIPVLALLSVAILLSFVAEGEQTVVTLGLTGLAIALGYLAVGVAGTFIAELQAVSLTAGGIVVLRPDFLQTLAMFLAYPFVLGVVGAAIGGAVSGSLRLE